MTTTAKVFIIIGIALTVLGVIAAVIIIFTSAPMERQIMDGPGMVKIPYISKAEYWDGNGKLIVLEDNLLFITVTDESGEESTESFYVETDPYSQIENIASEYGLFENDNLKFDADASLEYVCLTNKDGDKCTVQNVPDVPEEILEAINQVKEVLTDIPLESPVT